MKKIFLFFSLVLLLGIMYIASVNFETVVSLVYFKNSVYDIRISVIIISILILGLIIGSGIIYLFLHEERKKIKAYKRELEKSSITGTTNASKVEVLEAKIKTLESAFNSVVDDRTKLEIQIKSLNAELESINKNRKKSDN